MSYYDDFYQESKSVPKGDGVLKIFDTQDKFGKLSNNYISNTRIDDKSWPSVSHYVYAQPLCDPIYSTIIRNFKGTKGLKEEASKLYFLCQISVIKKAILKGYETKFRLPYMINALLETEDSVIKYNGEDPILSTGLDGKGENYIGNVLMSIRERLRIKTKAKEEEEKHKEENDKIYLTYIIFKKLNQLLELGKSDLSEFLDKPASEILTVFIDKDGKDVFMSQFPSRDVILQLYKQGKLDGLKEILSEIYQPKSLVYSIRKSKLREYSKRLERLNKNLIFDSYTTSVLLKKYPDVEEVEKAKAQQFSKLTDESLNFLIDKTYAMYKAGKITYSQQLYPLPTDEEIEKAESYEEVELSQSDIEESFINAIETPKKDEDDFGLEAILKKMGKEESKVETKEEPNDKAEVIVTSDPSSIFSPLNVIKDGDYFYLLIIDDLPFPTIAHYVCVSLINLFTTTLSESLKKEIEIAREAKVEEDVIKRYMKKGLARSHSYILIGSRENVNEIDSYLGIEACNAKKDELEQKEYIRIMEIANKRALTAKFENLELQQLLVATGKEVILYSDFSDPVLGTGSRKDGLNLTGVELMSLREKFVREGVSPLLLKERVSKVIIQFNQSQKGLEWINMKISDACRAVTLFYEYLKVKNSDYTLKMNREMVNFVLFSIYKSCGSLNDVEIEQIPENFEEQIKEFLPSKTSIGVVRGIWKYIFLLMHQVSLSVSPPPYKIDTLGKYVIFYADEIYRDDLERLGGKELDVKGNKGWAFFKNKKEKVEASIRTGRKEKSLDSFLDSISNNLSETSKPFEVCVLLGVKNILISLSEYYTRSGKDSNYIVGEEDISFALNLITPSGLDTEIELDYSSDDMIKKILLFFKGIGITRDMSAQIAWYINYISDINSKIDWKKRVNRIIYFCSIREGITESEIDLFQKKKELREIIRTEVEREIFKRPKKGVRKSYRKDSKKESMKGEKLKK